MTAEYVVSGHHGKDVLEDQRRASQKALTLADAYSAYIEALVRRGSSSGTLKLHDCNYRLRLAKFGDRPLASFSRQDCRDMHAQWLRSGAGPTGSNNTARMLKSVFNHALRKLETDLTFNPATAIEFYAQKNRRPILQLEDLPRWGEAVGRIPNANCRAFWFLILFTGLRRNDCASIKIDDIRWDEGVLHRPMPKGGQRRKFDVPLSDQVKAILRQAMNGDISLPTTASGCSPPRGGTDLIPERTLTR